VIIHGASGAQTPFTKTVKLPTVAKIAAVALTILLLATTANVAHPEK